MCDLPVGIEGDIFTSESLLATAHQCPATTLAPCAPLAPTGAVGACVCVWHSTHAQRHGGQPPVVFQISLWGSPSGVVHCPLKYRGRTRCSVDRGKIRRPYRPISGVDERRGETLCGPLGPCKPRSSGVPNRRFMENENKQL